MSVCDEVGTDPGLEIYSDEHNSYDPSSRQLTFQTFILDNKQISKQVSYP